MTVKAARTYDRNLIKQIMTEPDMWATVAEDGIKPDGFAPDVVNECWLVMTAGDDVVGLYNFHAHTSVTVEAHAHVLPQFRAKYNRATGIAALGWLYGNNAEYKKVIAQIPAIYKNVLRFTKSFGFKEEGNNRLSCLKNGEIVDRILLGITRDEIEVLLNEIS